MTEKTGFPLELVLTADGFLPELPGSQHTEEEEALLARWKENRCRALYHLGLRECPEGLSPSALYLYTVAEAFARALTSLPELEPLRERARVVLSDEEAAELLQSVPFVTGAEYVDQAWLEGLFEQLNQVFAEEVGAYTGTVAFYLTEQSQRLRVPERVFFHVVESRDEAFPFAFLATYATKGENGQITYVPLQYALTEYKNEREKLLELLACLNRAAEVSPLVGAFMESGELFHPLRLTAEEAFQLLKHTEEFEQAGILCRVPNWWRRHSAAVGLSISLGGKRPSVVGFDALVLVQPELAVDGVPLSREEIQALLAQTEGLALLKGRWVEVDHRRLRALLERIETVPDEVTLMDALRMEMDKPSADVGVTVTNGVWLGELLTRLRAPESIPAPALEELLAEHPVFLTVTTYGMAARMKKLQDIVWDCVILDEARLSKIP